MSGAAQNLIQTAHGAGKDIALMVSVLDGGAARWTKEHSPKTVTVMRPVWPDNPPQRNGKFYFDLAWFNAQIAPIRMFLPWIDYVQLYNEKHDNLASGGVLLAERDFNWECGREAIRQGFRVTLLNLAFGNLADDRMVPKEPDQFAVMKPMLDDLCRQGCALMYHCYNAAAAPFDPRVEAEYNALRFVHWCHLLPSLRVIGGEALVPDLKDPATGKDAVLKDPAQTVWQMQTLDGLIRQAVAEGQMGAEQFLGYAPFTGNPGATWQRFNMEPVYPAQAAYLVG